MNNQHSPNLAAGGTIRPFRFVKVSTAAGAAVVALGTGTTTQYTAGIALETAASGTITRMLWQPSADRPAIS